jgi:hypothetical protein
MFDLTYQFNCGKPGSNLTASRGEQACPLLVKGKESRQLARHVNAGGSANRLLNTVRHGS